MTTALKIKYKINNWVDYSKLTRNEEITDSVRVAVMLASALQQKQLGESMGVEWIHKEKMDKGLKSYFSDLTDSSKVLCHAWAYLYDAPCDLILEKMFDYTPNKKTVIEHNKYTYGRYGVISSDIWRISTDTWSILFNVRRQYDCWVGNVMFMGSGYDVEITNVAVYGDINMMHNDMLMAKLMGLGIKQE